MDNERAIKIVTGISIAIFAEACLVSLGWIFGIIELTRLTPGDINMKLPTAVMFLLSAAGLFLILRCATGNCEISSVILPGVSLSIIIIMGLIALDEILGVQTGLENILVLGEYPIYGWGSGLPSIITLINFLLFGVICIFSLFESAKRKQLIGFAGWFIAATGFLATMGYIFSLPTLYLRVDSLTPIALNTAISFFALGFAMIIISKLNKQA
jgi:hypothetical protein